MRFAVGLSLVLFAGASHAQPQLAARIHVGLDQHGDMGGLGAWQEAERAEFEQRGLAVAATDDFPSHISVEVAVGATFGTLGAGLAAGYSSTGGRLSYADYSGTLEVDRTVDRTSFGVYMEALPLAAGPVAVGGGLTLRGNMTTVAYQRQIMVEAESVESVDLELTAIPISAELALLAETALVGPLRASARIGYEVSQSASLNGQTLPPDAAAQDASVGWSGVRLSLGATIRL